MAPASIPEELRRFVLTSIPSVPHLEALLLLRSAATQDWPVAEVAGRLYITEKAASVLLDDLARAGMLAPTSTAQYRFSPRSPALGTNIDDLAAWYARRLVDVTHLIHSKLDRKAQQFADAFTWRKEP